jgi:hypothetical protein
MPLLTTWRRLRRRFGRDKRTPWVRRDKHPPLIELLEDRLLPSGGGLTLSPIAPINVAPGGYVAVHLQASDTNQAPITYSLKSTGPLPGGTLQPDGTLIFQPSPSDLGTYAFSVSASDGIEEVTLPVSLTVAGSAGATTRISGVIESQSGTPVAGVRVSLGKASMTTAADGSYTLTAGGNISGQFLAIHASQLKGAVSYMDFAVPIAQLTSQAFYSGYNNVVARPIYLVPVDRAGTVTVNPKKNITVTSSTVAGASLLIPAGSLRDQNGKLYTGKVFLAVISQDHTPLPLPAGQDSGLVVALEPVGSSGTQLSLKGGTLTMPNVGGFKPNTALTVTNSIGVSVGKGSVSGDGKKNTAGGLNLSPAPVAPEAQQQGQQQQYIEVTTISFGETPETFTATSSLIPVPT